VDLPLFLLLLTLGVASLLAYSTVHLFKAATRGWSICIDRSEAMVRIEEQMLLSRKRKRTIAIAEISQIGTHHVCIPSEYGPPSHAVTLQFRLVTGKTLPIAGGWFFGEANRASVMQEVQCTVDGIGRALWPNQPVPCDPARRSGCGVAS
jgi:hypothetical protein